MRSRERTCSLRHLLRWAPGKGPVAGGCRRRWVGRAPAAVRWLRRESRARGHARPRAWAHRSHRGALAKTAVCGCPPARWQAKEVGADAKLSSSQIVAISFPLYKLPAKTTPTRASRLVLDAALRVRSSRHVPASRRPDHRTDATRRARAAPHVGRRRVASVVAARLLFRPDVRREHAVEVPVPARAPHSINLREPRLGGVSAWQDRPAAPHAACARSAWHTQGRSEHNPKPQHDPKAKAKPTPTSSPDHARSRSSRPSTAQMPRCESRSAGESG